MIEQAILNTLRAHAPLLALLGNDPKRIDLLDVAQGTPAPYLTFNLTDGVQAGRGNLCNPAVLGLLNEDLLITPWAQSAPEVQQIHTAARAALLAAQRRQGDGTLIQSVTFKRFGPWGREPETNLLTRGQFFVVSHTE